MKTETITLEKAATLLIETVHGDLRLKGWDEPKLRAKTSGDTLELTREGEQISLVADQDLVLSVPRETAIQISEIKGDASLRHLEGAFTLQEIAGDLALRDAHGTIHIEQARGDCNLREITGNLHANIRGDLVLSINPKADAACQVDAGGDILLRLPEDVDAALQLSAKGDLQFRLADLVENTNPLERDLGSATASIHCAAGGDLLATAQTETWSATLGLDELISRKVEEGMQKAAGKTDKLKKLFGQQPATTPSVSDEERLLILKMLQEKKITAAEAEKLLDALG